MRQTRQKERVRPAKKKPHRYVVDDLSLFDNHEGFPQGSTCLGVQQPIKRELDSIRVEGSAILEGYAAAKLERVGEPIGGDLPSRGEMRDDLVLLEV